MIDADSILGKPYQSDAMDQLGCLTIVDLAGSEVCVQHNPINQSIHI